MIETLIIVGTFGLFYALMWCAGVFARPRREDYTDDQLQTLLDKNFSSPQWEPPTRDGLEILFSRASEENQR